MYKILIVGFGSIGYRYFEAIKRIKLRNIKLFIVDRKIKIINKKHNLNNNKISKYENLKSIPKKIDLCIISTTCQNRHILLKELINQTNFRNLILEKPLAQSPSELIKLNKILSDVKNAWVNTDRRSLEIYKIIKSKINIKNKTLMRVKGNSWGICCNSLHFIDLFSFITQKYLNKIEEKSKLKWFPSKRNGFQELDNGELKLEFGYNELYLNSKKSTSPKRLNIFIKNGNKKFYIKEKEDIFQLRHSKKTSIYSNEPTSVKMTYIIKKILLNKKSELPKYLNSTKLYYPLISYFLKKWQIHLPNSKKVPIT